MLRALSFSWRRRGKQRSQGIGDGVGHNPVAGRIDVYVIDVEIGPTRHDGDQIDERSVALGGDGAGGFLIENENPVSRIHGSVRL